MKNSKFLRWLSERLVTHYGESPNVDFVHKLRELADREQDREDTPRPVRVVRVLEYTYRDVDAWHEDQARWYVGVNGKRTHKHVTIKSATLPAELLDKLPETADATD